MKLYKKMALLIVLGVIAGFSYLGYQGLFQHDRSFVNTSDHNPLSSSKQKQNS